MYRCVYVYEARIQAAAEPRPRQVSHGQPSMQASSLRSCTMLARVARHERFDGLASAAKQQGGLLLLQPGIREDKDRATKHMRCDWPVAGRTPARVAHDVSAPWCRSGSTCDATNGTSCLGLCLSLPSVSQRHVLYLGWGACRTHRRALYSFSCTAARCGRSRPCSSVRCNGPRAQRIPQEPGTWTRQQPYETTLVQRRVSPHRLVVRAAPQAASPAIYGPWLVKSPRIAPASSSGRFWSRHELGFSLPCICSAGKDEARSFLGPRLTLAKTLHIIKQSCNSY